MTLTDAELLERNRKRPEEWERMLGVRILDPDGWRRDGKSFEDPLTWYEFNERMVMSTCEFGHGIVQEAKLREALALIVQHGCIDGAHHKQWVLDQVVRALTSQYDEWLKEYCAGEDGPETYEWDEGIAP